MVYSETLSGNSWVQSQRRCWRSVKKKFAVLIQLSQCLSLLSVPVCSATGTLSAPLCLFSAVSLDNATDLVGAVWSRHGVDSFKLQGGKAKGFFHCQSSSSLNEESVPSLLIYFLEISNSDRQISLKASCCKNRVDAYSLTAFILWNHLLIKRSCSAKTPDERAQPRLVHLFVSCDTF